MSVAAAVIEKVETPVVEPRRFQVPDLDTHGMWMLPRLSDLSPSMTQRMAANFLRGIIYANDYLFLFLPDAVGLVQVVRNLSFDPTPAVIERFVWCRDKKNIPQQDAALAMYDEFAKWAKAQRIEVLYVNESSDVPQEKIRERLGRIYLRPHQYVRL